MDTLKASKNQEADIKTSLEGLQKESGYLFDTGTPPSNFAAGSNSTFPARQIKRLRIAMRSRFAKINQFFSNSPLTFSLSVL